MTVLDLYLSVISLPRNRQEASADSFTPYFQIIKSERSCARCTETKRKHSSKSSQITSGRRRLLNKIEIKSFRSENIKRLLERSDGKYQFILHKERVYYASEDIVKKAGSCARENLVSVGVCFGKFTKTKKFRLQITALDYLAPYAQFKVWLKASSEQVSQFTMI